MSGRVIRNTCNNCCDMWKINLESLEWSKLEYSLSTGVYDHRMSIVNGCYLYSFGGYREEGCINTIERFIVQPPTLYRFCLQSISQAPRWRNYIKSLPVAIRNELNLNYYNSSFDD
ncbi:hypothetical protein RF11_12991 [Thelohanellus kitauei]|uniref:Kelch domain-containing protein 10 n=1 Tax=Thelohanellus kitauei TaxID=669202 RepID=A0A0C2JAI0_THEKT|nr:hypothetical protein RF11_12991 [Thelohanellus kitauei]